jgi:bile acid-coenzyme A ligase
MPEQARLRAEDDGSSPAVIYWDAAADPDVVTWADLVHAWELQRERVESLGVVPGELVVVPEVRHAGFIGQMLALWDIGASVLVTDPRIDLEVSQRLVQQTDWAGSTWARLDPHDRTRDIRNLAASSGGLPSDQYALLMTTSGSTGDPKVVSVLRSAEAPVVSESSGQRGGWYLTGGLSHTSIMLVALERLFRHGNVVHLLAEFDGAVALEVLRRAKVRYLWTNPYHMREMARSGASAQDLEKLRRVIHTGSPCDERTKLQWIGFVGPDRLFELYSASEWFGELASDSSLVWCSAREWLDHRGTVGRPALSSFSIVDDDQVEVPCGRIGHIVRRSDAGAIAVGDIGWMSEDGYLFVVGRASEVLAVTDEAILTIPDLEDRLRLELPSWASDCLVFLDDTGDRHVVIECSATLDARPDLLASALPALGDIPTTRIHLIDRLPRTSGGKVLRRDAARVVAASPAQR